MSNITIIMFDYEHYHRNTKIGNHYNIIHRDIILESIKLPVVCLSIGSRSTHLKFKKIYF